MKNVREPAEPADGQRVLVDRLWPRGVSKERAHLADWRRDLAPSDDLRRWFGHDPRRWDGFRQRYRRELADSGQLDALRELRDRARGTTATLVFGARDVEHNNAVALKELAESL